MLRSRRPATGVSRALRARSVPGVSPKMGGVRGSVRRGVPGALRALCPESVPGVSGTGHPFGHSLGHPPFSGTLSGTLRGHFGPKGPRDSCSRPAGSQPLWDNRPRDEAPPVPGTNGTKWRFYCGIQQKRPVVPGTGPSLSRGWVPFIPGTVPVCPGHRPAQNVYVYWFFFLSENGVVRKWGRMDLTGF